MTSSEGAIHRAAEHGAELQADVHDAPGLYWLGLRWLAIARQQYDEYNSESVEDASNQVPADDRVANRFAELIDQQGGALSAAIAQACFTGAQAAVVLADWTVRNENRAPYSDAVKLAQRLLRNGQIDPPHPALAEHEPPVHPALADRRLPFDPSAGEGLH